MPDPLNSVYAYSLIETTCTELLIVTVISSKSPPASVTLINNGYTPAGSVFTWLLFILQVERLSVDVILREK